MCYNIGYYVKIRVLRMDGKKKRRKFRYVLSLIFVLFLIVAVILNVKQLIDLNSSKTKWVIVAQSCATILVMFVSWSLSSLILDNLYECFL